MIKSKLFFVILLIISAVILVFSFVYKKSENDNKITAGKVYLESIIGTETVYSRSVNYSTYDAYEYRDATGNIYWLDKNKSIILLGDFDGTTPAFIAQTGSIEERSIGIVEHINPEFFINSYSIDKKNYAGSNENLIYISQLNSKGDKTGNYYEVFAKGDKINYFELHIINYP